MVNSNFNNLVCFKEKPVETNVSRTRLFIDFLMSVFIVVSIFPAFSSVATEVSLGIFIILCPLLLSKSSRISYSTKKHCVLLAIFLIVVLFYYVTGISNSFFSIVGNYLDWALGIFLCCFTYETSTKKEKNYFLSFCFIVFNLSMLIVLMQSKKYVGIELSDVANASYSTFIMLFSGSCIIYLLNGKGRIVKLFVLGSLFLSTYLNFFILQRGTNIVLTLLMLLLILIFKVKSKFLRTIFIIAIVSFAFVLYNSNLIDNLFSYLSSKFDVIRIQERVYTILNFLKSGDYQNAGVRSFSYRIEYFFNSLKSFGKRPFFGVGDHRESYEIIGNHSEIIDNFGRYGVVGGIVFLSIIVYHISFLWKKNVLINKSILLQITVIPIIFIMRNLTGVAIGSAFGILFFIFIPAEIDLFINQRVVKKR